MPTKKLIQNIGFQAKENTSGIFIKKYSDGYSIEVDFEKNTFYFGGKIKIQGKDSQNICKPEDWVVLECLNRLLEKGYKPENISLEKVYPAGHGFSGRLDICVTREDGSEYLLIECKTYGKEFDKEFTRIKKDGGQLFTYFKFSNKADVLMLYASELNSNDIIYKNEIVKIEDDYRAGDVKDFYEKWNKLTKDNGVFDNWVNPYNFESKALTINDLEEIRQEDSSFIFNRFLEILRHNVVSDKGNAFNRIFTLFLCKIYDEKTNEGTDNELGFQWLEGVDNHRSFQLRLTDLYKNGMYEFLEKVVTDFSETDFKNKFSTLTEEQRNPIIEEFRKIRLEKNNEFAIKDVYDEQSFNENAVVVKEIVELLQKYKLRYTKKQQYLSDFFELLLTTGLKQESGQFFTPVPVAQFVIKSLPIDTILRNKLNSTKIDNDTLLPYVMDYAAGSGHFLTETMHEMQRLIDQEDDKSYNPSIAKKIRNWKDDHFAWAMQYVYGIEKDYRLVKVGKVGCYLHGDGLANVIHSDGLANFSHPDYKGKLLIIDKDFPQENKQFDIIVSNPPYSVSAFKNAARSFYKDNDFELYNKLTDSSSEIECLFIERTKQLLKDGGVAGIILPSSILSNTGIYSRSREIILQYFDIVGITELGSNTFMATGTNTVALFLRRRNNYESANIKIGVEKFFSVLQDVTLNGIEKPVAKYVNHVWEGISFEDYVSLLKKEPNKVIETHEIYAEYKKKLKAKNDKEFWNLLLEKETDKLYYFIIAYPQKIVLIKSGEKDAEKRFLGYEFSNRRGSEGIHPTQKGKNIEDCTQLFDPEVFDNPQKASTYIYKAFAGDYNFTIDKTMERNVTRHDLIDMLTFDRVEFEKTISLSIKKKVKFEKIWGTEKIQSLDIIADIKKGTSITKEKTISGNIPVVAGGQEPAYFHNESNRNSKVITVSASGAYAGFVNYFETPIFASDCNTIISKDENIISTKLIYLFLKVIQNEVYNLQRGQAQPHVYGDDLSNIKIPLPLKSVQEKIANEIQVLEINERKANESIDSLKNNILGIIEKVYKENKTFSTLDKICEIKRGRFSHRPRNEPRFFGGNYPFIQTGDVVKAKGKSVEYVQTLNEDGLSVSKLFQPKIVLVTIAANIGDTAILDYPACFTDSVVGLIPFESVNVYFLELMMRKQKQSLDDNAPKVAQKNINIQILNKVEIPMLPLYEQQKIVSEIGKIEEKIKFLEKEIAEMPKQKEAVLKKYL